MQTFPSQKSPTEAGIFGFQFTLQPAENITAATATMTCVAGVDPAAPGMLTSLPTWTNALVGVRVQGGLAGNGYRLFVQITTSLDQILEGEGLVQISA